MLVKTVVVSELSLDARNRSVVERREVDNERSILCMDDLETQEGKEKVYSYVILEDNMLCDLKKINWLVCQVGVKM